MLPVLGHAMNCAALLIVSVSYSQTATLANAADEILERRLPDFVAKNAPLDRVVDALNELGIRTCVEWRGIGPGKSYGDAKNIFAFSTNEPVLSFELKTASVRNHIDEINRQVPNMLCRKVDGANLLNIVPRKSNLEFQIPAMTLRGPLDQLMKQDSPFAQALLAGGMTPSFSRFVIDLELPAMRARDVLNRIVSSQSVLSWQYYPWGIRKTWFGSHLPDPREWQGVFLIYDVNEMSQELAERSQRNPRLWLYHAKEIEVGGQRAIVVEKRKHYVMGGLPILKQTERDVTQQFMEVVDAVINEDIDLLMQSVNPKGVKIGQEKCCVEAVRARIKKEFALQDYTRLLLSDVIDRNTYRIVQDSPKSFRVSCRSSVKHEKAVGYFFGEFSLVFEQSAEGQWLIAEMPEKVTGPID